MWKGMKHKLSYYRSKTKLKIDLNRSAFTLYNHIFFHLVHIETKYRVIWRNYRSIYISQFQISFAVYTKQKQ